MKTKIIFYLFFLPFFAISQTLPTIQTDRPDQTECPFIVPKNYFQFENGFSFEKINNDEFEIIAPTVLIKYGINDVLELRLISELQIDTDQNTSISGINPVLIGFKTRLFKEKGVLPTTSFIAHLMLPKIATARFQKTDFAPEFRFTMQHSIGQKQTLSYNLGSEWNGENSVATYIYTLASGYSFSEKISGYVEFYGFLIKEASSDHRFDGGLCYLVNANHQIDISTGIGLSDASPKYFVGFGYSFRFGI